MDSRQVHIMKLLVIPLNIAKKNKIALGAKSITLIERKNVSDLWSSRVSSFITEDGNKTEKLKFFIPIIDTI